MSKTGQLTTEDYASLLAEVKERVRAAQYAALKVVNKELVTLYWDIGRLIVNRQADAAHGDAIAEQLASDLRVEFPGVGGYSRRNIFYMREFYLTYRDLPKVQPLVAQIGWTQNLIILQHCKNSLEREFYIRMTKKFGWTKNILIHQIENQSYEKTLLGQTNFDKTVTPAIRAQAKLAVKDEYTFDFLEMGEEHSERELERALIARVEQFLRAMGGLFAFVGSQFRLEVEDKEYFIDLLLYHRRLKCLVAVELKIGDSSPSLWERCNSILRRSTSRCASLAKTPASVSLCAKRRIAQL
jgi:predicted nuclease of restriction endonuclease-like (RecB) superfamily